MPLLPLPQVEPGCWVKVAFLGERNGSRELFWCFVLEVLPPDAGQLLCRVDNELVHEAPFRCGDRVLFPRDCVLDVATRSDMHAFCSLVNSGAATVEVAAHQVLHERKG